VGVLNGKSLDVIENQTPVFLKKAGVCISPLVLGKPPVELKIYQCKIKNEHNKNHFNPG